MHRSIVVTGNEAQVRAETDGETEADVVAGFHRPAFVAIRADADVDGRQRTEAPPRRELDLGREMEQVEIASATRVVEVVIAEVEAEPTCGKTQRRTDAEAVGRIGDRIERAVRQRRAGKVRD